MSPLELEIYHQMRNVIGIDPAFYEYIFTVDADTVRHLMVFITHSLIFYVFRLLHRTLSIVWLLPVQMIPKLLAYVEKPSSQMKKARGGLLFKSMNTTSPTIYPKLLRVFSDLSPVYLVALVSTVFIRPTKEGQSSSPVP